MLSLAAAMLLTACGEQELYRDVSEGEANEMIAVLMNSGIDSSKVAEKDEGFTVEVGQGDFARAVEVLRENGLPRERFESLGTVFKKEGFTSSSLAERARLVYGLSQELSNTISQFDGVVDARVHLAMPEADPLTGAADPPSASVFVKYRGGFDLRSQTAAIKSLVTNSIEGLAYDNVSIAMTEARPLPAPPPPTMSDRVSDWIVPLAGSVGAFLLAFGGWQMWSGRRSAARRSGLPVSRAQGRHG